MPIENRNLTAGTRLVARYKGQDYVCEVIETEEGIRYRLEDGQEFSSPSSAGSAVTGGKACNGWRFWSLAGSEEAKPKKAAKKPSNSNGNRVNGLISRLEDGRFFCSACQEPFQAPEGVEPQGCPKGHRPEDFETA
jgi:hypothetical protein